MDPISGNKPWYSQKKWLVAITVFFVFVILIIIFLLLNSQKKPETASLSETPSPAVVSPTLSDDQQTAVQQAIAEQQKSDQEYADWQSQTRKDFPWRNKLPLHGEKYYFYFDIDKNMFVGMLYPIAGDDIEQIKTAIKEEMKRAEIPTDTYPISWTVEAQ